MSLKLIAFLLTGTSVSQMNTAVMPQTVRQLVNKPYVTRVALRRRHSRWTCIPIRTKQILIITNEVWSSKREFNKTYNGVLWQIYTCVTPGNGLECHCYGTVNEWQILSDASPVQTMGAIIMNDIFVVWLELLLFGPEGLTVQGVCIHGSPSICIGRDFLVLGEEQ